MSEQSMGSSSARNALGTSSGDVEATLESVRNDGSRAGSSWTSETASQGGGGQGNTMSGGQGTSTSGGGQGMTEKLKETTTEKMSQVGDQASSKLDAGMEKAAGGLGTLAETMRDKSGSMSEGQVQTIVSTAADKIESGADMLRQKDTDQLITDLETFVRSKPVESLLIAAGIGFVVSKAMR